MTTNYTKSGSNNRLSGINGPYESFFIAQKLPVKEVSKIRSNGAQNSSVENDFLNVATWSKMIKTPKMMCKHPNKSPI